MQNLSVEHINQWGQQTADYLYENYYRLLVSYALTLVGDRADAEDMVQEVLTSLWQLKPQFSTEGQLRAYLYNSVAHRVTSQARHQAVHRRFADARRAEENDQADTPDSMPFEEEVYARLFQLIDAMPERQRQVFLLLMEGKRNTEIAQMLNISADTVKTQKQRGLSKLRQSMSKKQLAWLLAVVTI